MVATSKITAVMDRIGNECIRGTAQAERVWACAEEGHWLYWTKGAFQPLHLLPIGLNIYLCLRVGSSTQSVPGCLHHLNGNQAPLWLSCAPITS